MMKMLLYVLSQCWQGRLYTEVEGSTADEEGLPKGLTPHAARLPIEARAYGPGITSCGKSEQRMRRLAHILYFIAVYPCL